MAVRKSKSPVRKPAARPAKARQAKPSAPGRDVTQYADKEPTELHKTMARWIVTEVGYDPNTAGSKREAFLMGVSIATAARPAFTSSEYLAAWYEESGTPKRGRGASANSERRPAKAAAPEPEPEDDDTDDVDEELAALEEELNGLAIGALRKAAKEEYDVSGSGTKAEIINRILDSLADEDDDDETEEDAVDEEEEEADDDGDLDDLREELDGLSARDLQAAAKEYGVTPKRGERKAALIDRILDAAEEADDVDDEEEDEEEEEPPTKARKGSKAAPSKASKEFLF